MFGFKKIVGRMERAAKTYMITTLAAIETTAMQAENNIRAQRGESLAYDDCAYMEVHQKLVDQFHALNGQND